MLPAFLNLDTKKPDRPYAPDPAGQNKRMVRRTIARNRANSRVVTRIPNEILQHDPLVERRRSWIYRAGAAALFLFVAVGLEVLMFGASAILGFSSKSESSSAEALVEKVTFMSVEEKPLAPVEPEPEPEVVAQVVTEESPSFEPVVKKKTRSRSKPREVRPDPVNEKPQEDEAPAQPRRRVIGINLESTTSGGSGASFAVGNTRMGQTDDLAVDARSVDKLVTRKADLKPEKQRNDGRGSPNTVSTRAPSRGVELVKPKRLSQPKLAYPSLLKSQGIEANVGVVVKISDKGSVTSVKVVKSSGYNEFDKVARDTASKEKFEPARRGGESIAYTLRFTYRFRIKDV